VLREVIETMPCESTVYLGDTARVPYGTKSAETVTAYAIENSEFLLTKDVKLIIVACNTATAYALAELKNRFDVPIIGVIEPGAAAAVASTKTRHIGIIGTEGTVRSEAYSKAIKEIDPKAVVHSKACPLFVPLAEEGWADTDVAKLTAENYLRDLKKQNIDVMLLGCTHYPLLKNTIASVMSDEVELIDSAVATAKEVERAIIKNSLSAKDSSKGEHGFFVTDSPERFEEVGRKFLRSSMNAELIKLKTSDRTLSNG
jgi:glutamate racemase